MVMDIISTPIPCSASIQSINMSPPDSSLYSPYFTPSTSSETADESPAVQQIISSLSLLSHPEGGRYVETDRDARIVPNPFLGKAMVGGGKIDGAGSAVGDETEKDETRNASTTIYYHLSPLSNYGSFHRNAGRTVHTVHKGRGRQSFPAVFLSILLIRMQQSGY